MELEEVGKGGNGSGRAVPGLLYAPTPPLPRHVFLHVTDAFPSLPRYTPRHPRIHTEYSISDSRIPYAEADSLNYKQLSELKIVRK
jgi:hypothetical protein